MASATQPIARRRLPHVDAVRAAALRAFAEEHPGLALAPVLVVIAALDEQGAIGQVVDEVPRRACGLDVDVLIVDDGSTDATSDVARERGARVVRLERNCGHGVALRVGYRVARERGARFIVTLDGDGQWNPTELEGVLAPVAAGEADMVIGSRVLGHSETDDSFRQAGVHVFGALVRLLTGSRVTDTSSGFRAMTVELAATVRQEQVQYQTSELLIGALLQGFRVDERPITMRRRLAGESKKGHNVLYGARYASVILRTWLRERRTSPLAPRERGPLERALPALRAGRFLLAVALVAAMGVLAVRDVSFAQLRWSLLAGAVVLALAWWLLLACTWSVLAAGRVTAADVGTWCRTQVLRYLPGGIWAPTSRVAVTAGSPVDRLATVAAENVVALCAAAALGGVALAAGGRPAWAPLALLVALPALAAGPLRRATRLDRARLARATAGAVGGFAAYLGAAVLVQAAVSGWSEPLLVAGAAGLAWAAGLVVVIAPGGLGARELAYVALLGGVLPRGDIVSAAVVLRATTIAAELAVLVAAGRPRGGWTGGSSGTSRVPDGEEL